MKKVLQHFLGKTMILVSLLFAFNQESTAQITMTTANCVITANEVQMDIRVTNNSLADLRWNSTVIRMTVPAAMLPNPVTLGTYSFQYLGGSDFPLSWPTVFPANASGASFTTSSRLLTWTTGSPGSYNNLTPPCAAPLIAGGVTKTIGRFSFKRTDANFIASGDATFVWSTTSSCNLYQVCAGAVTGYNAASGLRTLGPVCPLTVPGSCAVTGVATVTNPACFGGTGSASVLLSGSGSGAPLTYTVDGGASQNAATNPFTVSGLSAGNHTIIATVTAGGCISSSIAANVTAPTQLVASGSAGTIACFGGTTTVVVSATGGTAPYTGTGSFSHAAGGYSYTVTDANGCTSVALGNINQPTQLVASGSAGTIACFGGSTTVVVSATGGTPPYTGTGSFTHTAGAYSHTVTDANGCTSIASGNITQPTQLVASGSAGTIACFGGSTTVVVSATGGTAPYTGTGSFSHAAGGYSYTVTDANGCTSIASGNITQPTQLVASASAGTIACFGGTTTVVVSATGGTAPYTGTGSFTAGAGPYSYTVTDANGCTSVASGTIANGAALTGSSSGSTAPTCAAGTNGTSIITLSSVSTLQGSQQVPPVASPATGTIISTFNSTTSMLTLNITFSGLLANTTDAHIHLGAAGTNGGVQIGLVSAIGFPLGVTSGAASGSILLTAPQAASLLAGNYYVNIHTAANPGGEIRSQLSVSTSGIYTVDGGSSQSYGSNPFTVSGLSSGSHTVVATSVAGCLSNSIAVSIGSTAALTGSGTTTPTTTCIPGNEGTATITLSTSTSGTYTVDGGSSVAYSSNPFTVTGLTAGSHNIVATSAAGCVSNTIAVTVGAAGGLTGSGTGGSVTCFGGNDGTASITLSSGTSGTYTVDGGSALSFSSNPFTVSGLTAGNHSIVATSAGCLSNIITVTVGSPAALTGSATATDVSCFGGTNGTMTVTLSASTSGTYSIDGNPAVAYSSNPFTISGLAAGSHSVVATSAAGCVSTSISATVNSPAALTGSGTTTPVSCASATDGTATITLSTSTSGTYTVDGGSSVAYSSNPFTITGLSGGNHTIIATSSAGCVSGLIGVNVGTPAALTGTGTTTPTTCGNPTSGTATITLSGSTSGTYKVDGGSSVAYSSNPFTITGLTAGNHTIVATSAAGCVSSNILVNVGASATFTVTLVKTNLSACNVTPNGTITLTPVGGTGPYTYTWSGETGSNHTPFTAGNVSSLTGLNYGYYNVTITDLGGCGSVTYTNIHVEFAYYVYITNSGSNSSVCGSTGSVVLYGNSGITPYTYALSPGTAPAGTYQASNTFTGLAAGPYTAYVKDAGGCVSTKSVTVGSAAAIVVTPFAVGASSCAADGSIQIFRTGGTPPYMYSLNGVTYQASNLFTGLAAGPYIAYVKDGAGCVGQQNATVAAGTGVSATISKVNTSTCVNDGSIQVNATGGVPAYMYSLNGGAYQSGNSFPGLAAGNYTVQVKDSKGCLSSLINVTINLNTIVVTASATAATSCSSNNGKIQLFRTGGYGPYTYSIDGTNYQTSTLFTGVAAGTYTGYVKDFKTCIGFLTGIVVGPTGCPPPPVAGTNTKQGQQVVTGTAVLTVQAYPNPTASEFTLSLNGYDSKAPISITVTDLLGRKVYQTQGTGKSQYRFGTGFINGMYNVQVIQGAQKASLKLVKE